MVNGKWSLHIFTNRASFRSLNNLRLLNVSNSTFMDSNKFCVVVALAKLRNLQVLNVSNTELEDGVAHEASLAGHIRWVTSQA